MAFFTRHKVDQHPHQWPSCALSNRHVLPSEPGIYAAMRGRQILYIGKSINLRERWQGSSHHRYEQLRRKGRCRLHWVVLQRQAIHDKEQELIQKWQPPLNNTRVPTFSRWKGVARSLQVVGVVAVLLAILFPSAALDLAQQLYEFGRHALRK